MSSRIIGGETGLCNLRLDDSHLKSFPGELSNNTTLKTLEIDQSTTKVMCETLTALVTNSTLTSLSFSVTLEDPVGTPYGDVVLATAIACLIKDNTSLEKLGATHSGIGLDGATHIANALIANSTLKRIDFSYNYIGEKGVDILLETYKQSPTLEIIRLKGNLINQENCLELDSHKELDAGIDEKIKELKAVKTHNKGQQELTLLQALYPMLDGLINDTPSESPA